MSQPTLDFSTTLDHELRQLTDHGSEPAVRELAARELTDREARRGAAAATIDELLARAGFECMHSRNLDSLDFKQMHVETMRELLVAAFDAGKRAGGGK